MLIFKHRIVDVMTSSSDNAVPNSMSKKISQLQVNIDETVEQSVTYIESMSLILIVIILQRIIFIESYLSQLIIQPGQKRVSHARMRSFYSTPRTQANKRACRGHVTLCYIVSLRSWNVENMLEHDWSWIKYVTYLYEENISGLRHQLLR